MIFHWTSRSDQVCQLTWQPCFFMAGRWFFHTNFNFQYILQCALWGNPVVGKFVWWVQFVCLENSNKIFQQKFSITWFLYQLLTLNTPPKWDTWYLPISQHLTNMYIHTLKHSKIENRHMKQTSAKKRHFHLLTDPLKISNDFAGVCVFVAAVPFFRRANFSYSNGWLVVWGPGGLDSSDPLLKRIVMKSMVVSGSPKRW